MKKVWEKVMRGAFLGKGQSVIFSIAAAFFMVAGLAGCAALETSNSFGQSIEETMGSNLQQDSTEVESGFINGFGESEEVNESDRTVTDDDSAEGMTEIESSGEEVTDGEHAEATEEAAAEEITATEKDFTKIMEQYNAGLDLEDNPFWDSLVYTGYNIEKHRSDGLMWHYVLAAHKRGKGWLSDITYAGGSTGYETTEEGVPDIGFFEDYGLVCASYVTYVYFNYLPNVAGIDTSVLTKPEKSYSANDWYIAAKDWVEQGYSETIDFEASLTGAGFIDFETLEEMPVGSIIAFCDSRNKSDHCSHVVIYAGYENNYHWVYHVGNENGPEFCSVERMHFGPDPQWPIAVITTPDFVMEALTESTQESE